MAPGTKPPCHRLNPNSAESSISRKFINDVLHESILLGNQSIPQKSKEILTYSTKQAMNTLKFHRHKF